MKVFLILYMAIFLLGFVGLGYIHEQVHVEIYRGYGIDSHVEYLSHFPDLVTIADEPCPNEFCTLANDMNEVVSYPLFIFYAFMGVAIFIILILYITRCEIEENKLEIMRDVWERLNESDKKKK